MSPLRLVLLAVLFYCAYRLLRSVLSKKGDDGPENKAQAAPVEQVEDILVTDPVCGILIPRQQAVRLRHGDVTLYFCSDACCDRFIEEQKGKK